MKRHLLLLLCSCLSVAILRAQTCGSTNLALGRPITSTSAPNYGLAGNLVDASSSSFFWPNDRDTDQWAWIQLASPATICRVVVKWRLYSQGNFKIQVTNTNPAGGGTVTWTDVAVVSSNNNPTVDGGDAINDLSIPNSYGVNQYVRLYIMAPLGNCVPEEVEVYGALANQKPAVSITAPSYSSQFTEGNTISISANASDADGTIKKVEFYHDDTWLGVDSTAPYTMNWSNVPTGNYQLFCVAFDNQNDTAESGYVSISVNSSPANAWSVKGNSSIKPDSQFLGTLDNSAVAFRVGNIERARFDSVGRLLINTSVLQNGDSTTMLAVKGSILAKNLRITQLNWADYVFAQDYKLMPLHKVGEYIKQNKHLPGIPATGTIMQKGLDVGSGQTMLLEKLEELTLYLLDQNRKIELQQKKIERQQKEIDVLKKAAGKAGSRK
ncbi:MAG: discoidin domain-containing protein [Bacteroidetes bacterium]|nr:discoidin domain-containing protein [Bacteroidota bacterium]